MSQPWDYDKFDDLDDSDEEATTLELLRRYKHYGNAHFSKKEYKKAVRHHPHILSLSNSITHS